MISKKTKWSLFISFGYFVRNMHLKAFYAYDNIRHTYETRAIGMRFWAISYIVHKYLYPLTQLLPHGSCLLRLPKIGDCTLFVSVFISDVELSVKSCHVLTTECAIIRKCRRKYLRVEASDVRFCQYERRPEVNWVFIETTAVFAKSRTWNFVDAQAIDCSL